jgi:type IX secretion system PorP/SprF family membrane protein
MKKNSLSFILIFGFVACINAQQLPIFSNYFFNDYVINPAFTGSERFSPVQVTYRNQWLGFNGPQTLTAGGHTFLENQNIGIGGMLFSDDMGGAISQRGVALNFSYRIVLNDRSYLATGLAGVINQYAYDGSNIIAAVHTDQSLFSQQNQVNPDVNFGLAYVLDDRLKIGISANQLIEKRMNTWNELSTGSDNRLVRQVNVTASYLAQLQRGVELESYGIFRTTFNTPMQFDLGSRLLYKGIFYAGLAYRHLDAVSILAGYKNRNFVVGYSYDYTTSALNQYSTGSHEIVLSYRLKVNKRRIVSRSVRMLDQF